MLARFSVKKPFYILAAAIIVLMLGGVSLTYMKTNLLPEMELPYLMVITTDPGATPEQVESDVTDVLEGQLSTVTGIENVYSQSSENYSMVMLEFAEDTDMDSALVKTSAAVNQVIDSLPDSAGTPTYIEMNMDSMASMYVGVADSDKDIVELTSFVNDTVLPALERQEGVAQVTASGLVTDTVDVELSDSKIEDVNNRILANVNDKLSDSKAELDDAQAQLDSARATISDQQAQLDASKSSTENQLATATEGLNTALSTKSAYQSQLTSQQAQYAALAAQYQAAVTSGDTQTAAQIQAQMTNVQAQEQVTQSILDAFETNTGDALDNYNSVETGKMDASVQFATAQSQITSATQQLDESQSELDSARQNYEDARQQAIDSANIDQLVDVDTLGNLVTAQNFSMPAGYVKNDAGDQWMLKVGEGYSSVDELRDTVLTTIDGVGDIRLSDVADVTVIDNEGENYAKLNGNDGIILSISKTSTASTSDVSKVVNSELQTLEDDNPTLQVMNLSDQGEYISLYINTILQSLLIGAVLAIVVLALFLRNIRPTLVVAFSIPFSVLFALVIMYFTGITINIMSLGALSLSIGMLVDSSIVVMENIYRLRARGYSAPRAAAQGAVQVTGAIVASTLTTICVFLPFVFTTGYVRQLMVPFALTISFTLIASLIVALTCVPALGARMFRNSQPKPSPWFEKLQDSYGRALATCLRHKAPVLVVAVGLLGVCVFAVLQMGIVMIPNMESNQISITAEMPEDMSKDDAYVLADQVMDAIDGVDGVSEVGGADSNTTSAMMMGSATGSDLYSGTFMYYAIPDDSVTTEAQVAQIKQDIQDATAGLGCTVSTDSSATMMSELSGSSLEVDIKGDDNATLLDLSNQVVAAAQDVEGYSKVENGQEKAADTIQMTFDKDAVAKMGTTVAQIYQQLSAKLNSSTDSISVPEGGNDVTVKIENNRNQVTVDNLMDTTFTITKTDSDGSQTTEEHALSEVATSTVQPGYDQLGKENGVHYMKVTADVDDGYNTTLLQRDLQPKLDQIDVPDGYSIEIAGTNQQIADMIQQMLQLMVLGAVLIYLVMMAQFHSFVAPFIVILTVPLAFTGGLLALMITGEQLSMMSLLGFVILMGTVVNNGIVFVDYANQMRKGGLEKRDALIVTGKTRMRPIMMTALTTILAMCSMIFSPAIGSSLERGMALVVAGGLLYATFMTLFVVPIVYDLLYRRPVHDVDLEDDVDDESDDAAEFIAQLKRQRAGESSDGDATAPVVPATPKHGPGRSAGA